MHYYLMIALNIGLCVLIGFLGSNRKLGFWGAFFGSILFTPVIGLLLVLVSCRDKKT